ncbi:hypothetical protein H6A35_09065 [Collinsella tanakaei]|nr:hypothetical protein [Collinsella tanakaei]
MRAGNGVAIRRRILNKRLAAIVASIRHGEMIFVADAGSGFPTVRP